jgi:hypothetical protein
VYLPLFYHSRQKKIRIHSHPSRKRRDLGKNSLTLLIEPSLEIIVEEEKLLATVVSS